MEKAKLRGKLHLACEKEIKDLEFEEQVVVIIHLEDELKQLVKQAKWRKAAKEPLYIRRK